MFDLMIFLGVSGIICWSMLIYGWRHSEIGDAGAITVRMNFFLEIMLGIVFLIYAICIMKIYAPFLPKEALIFLVCTALFIFLLAGIRLVGFSKEKTVQLETTILRDLSYITVYRPFPYTILIGNADENKRNQFCFRGPDYRYLKECRKNGCTTMKIEYYPNTGRIYKVTPY